MAQEGHERGLTPRLVFGLTSFPRKQPQVGTQPLELYPPQEQALQKALDLGHLLISAEPGCGKTAVALSIGKAINAKRTLVVCPAGVRKQWRKQKELWWPDMEQCGGSPLDETVRVVSKASDWDTIPTVSSSEDASSTLAITSYELLRASEGWDLLIFDEAQYAKNYTTKRTRACDSLVKLNPNAMCLCLTGTPIDVSPSDVFNVLNLTRPGGFGWYSQFRDRYCLTQNNGFGIEVIGANPETLDEFRYRLNAVSSRFTLADLAPWLPALSVTPIYLSNMGTSDADARVGAVLSWMEELNEAKSAQSRSIVTYFKSTATRVAEALRASKMPIEVVSISGDDPVSKRDGLIAHALETGATLVATMKSIGVGRDDLVHFKEVFIAELYPVPSAMAQLLGRWRRLSSTGRGSRVCVAVVEGVDDRYVASLTERSAGATAVVGEASADSAIASLERVYTDEQLQAMFSE